LTFRTLTTEGASGLIELQTTFPQVTHSALALKRLIFKVMQAKLQVDFFRLTSSAPDSNILSQPGFGGCETVEF
jgi:hypothetical protein